MNPIEVQVPLVAALAGQPPPAVPLPAPLLPAAGLPPSPKSSKTSCAYQGCRYFHMLFYYSMVMVMVDDKKSFYICFHTENNACCTAVSR